MKVWWNGGAIDLEGSFSCGDDMNSPWIWGGAIKELGMSIFGSQI